MNQLVLHYTTLQLVSLLKLFNSVNVATLGVGSLQEATGQIDFRYFTVEAKEMAEVFVSYVYQYESAVQSVVEEFKSTYTIHGDLVEQCAASITNTEVNSTVTISLKKVQKIDNDILSNSMICTSLRVALPDSCVEARRQSMEALADVACDEELERIKIVVIQASASFKTSMQSCVGANISS